MQRSVFDHVMYGASDLDACVEEMFARTGIRAAYGGSHPGFGTHNALLGLGDRRYLELIAPVPGQEASSPLAALLAQLQAPRIILWAVRTKNIETAAGAARARGYDPGSVTEVSRTTPEGMRLSWRLTFGGSDVALGVLPFLIQWTGDTHPADNAPQGCVLGRLRAEHPRAGEMRAALDALGVGLNVEPGSTATLHATLETPRGRVELR
jgi:hypothetical protein